jgi:hypothetical protein
LAAKILRDKEVSPFPTLDFTDIDDVFSRIATHYGSSLSSESLTSQEREALAAASQAIAQFSHLGHMTAESLGYVYENTLISKEIRSRLGIHSTPSYLVDYIVWRLAPWIAELPAADRRVFEPACGHTAFLVAAMRLLKELLSASTTPQTSRTMAAWKVRYRRVRESDVQRFREAYVATTERIIPQMHFASNPLTDRRLPELEEVWEWCKSLPRFDSLANIGKGLEYKGSSSLPRDIQTLSSSPFPGTVRGFARLTSDLRIDGRPPEVWMSVDPIVISRPRSGTTVGVPQILLNYAPVSRFPWRFKAVIDREGHAVTSRFLNSGCTGASNAGF